MTHLIDYNVSVPAVVTDQVHIPIPQTPDKVILAELGIFIAPHFTNNRVQLIANVGVTGDPIEASISQILFRVFRGTQEIYYALQGVEADFERNEIVTLQVIDINVPIGAHGYSLYVEKLSQFAEVTIVGPINMSAAVYAV
ncbi:hypothetical protein [Paenibacillus sp. OV219]|uniref:hypothetical protein n=1 Tax=Paenibacillus sp. OV219 TaxID=1884377 RepID=UPI0008D6F8C5|nr:hypothetical protein [Paenibacillus sp. OV219]SEM72737.1 hypothetical protein SAMN05518847_101630 [Paenibacillus sp. OV219]